MFLFLFLFLSLIPIYYLFIYRIYKFLLVNILSSENNQKLTKLIDCPDMHKKTLKKAFKDGKAPKKFSKFIKSIFSLHNEMLKTKTKKFHNTRKNFIFHSFLLLLIIQYGLEVHIIPYHYGYYMLFGG